MTALELINKLPAAFNPEAAAGIARTIQFNTSQPAYVAIRDGACNVTDTECEGCDGSDTDGGGWDSEGMGAPAGALTAQAVNGDTVLPQVSTRAKRSPRRLARADPARPWRPSA